MTDALKIETLKTDWPSSPGGEHDDLLAYTGDTIRNEEDGREYKVIDTENTDFSSAKRGRKSDVTMVVEAKGGENTAQIFENNNETNWPYTAQEGDAIFVQGDIEACLKFIYTGDIDEDHGPIDVYVPDNAKHSETGRLQFADLEKEGYEIQPPNDHDLGTFVKSPSALILHKANTDWACIAAQGKQVKFFPPGSSFKLLDGAVSGINPEAFDTTWELIQSSQANDHDGIAGGPPVA